MERVGSGCGESVTWDHQRRRGHDDEDEDEDDEPRMMRADGSCPSSSRAPFFSLISFDSSRLVRRRSPRPLHSTAPTLFRASTLLFFCRHLDSFHPSIPLLSLLLLSLSLPSPLSPLPPLRQPALTTVFFSVRLCPSPSPSRTRPLPFGPPTCLLPPNAKRQTPNA
ncbi:hypothetical protein CC85DRAFT_23701 [Cutaneotrichosporon oleaginosum]|uniref:Uncharacterized protein n=1 Tax=Cutaneotrichosporon oleaginosum TaxID=879819 RepID=A0A0J0XT03_9TREE|nr:uncharacterized protein CC85DRAFT_23701 [Cutaneotrichosporon oleaginosum]KLT44218.1 hypothetical protein CC85DRAFT_23701 [Cutaneotrichosporon oleaginosum]TXT11614.1 hypothetical protein COLE_02024 [Cutaneotrichosporon oleaginosum]